jgi:hypothetical protein
MLARLAVFGDTSFEFTSTAGDDENSAIRLRSASDHVFDKVTMTRGIDDLYQE